MLNSKKSIELSLNFIVILILSLAILGFGVRFMSNLFSKATDISKYSADDFDRQITNLICSGSERVCVTAQRKAISKGDYSVIGMKIINVLEPPLGQPAINFEITVNTPDGPPTGLLGYDKKDQPILKTPDFDGLMVVLGDNTNPNQRVIDLEKYGEINLGFAVQPPNNAQAGTYILNIVIKANGNPYGQQKVYIDVP